MTTTADIAPEMALKLVEAERMQIRDWDLQRRGHGPLTSTEISDDQVEQSIAKLTDLARYLPTGDRQDIERLISIVRTRLDLRAGSEE